MYNRLKSIILAKKKVTGNFFYRENSQQTSCNDCSRVQLDFTVGDLNHPRWNSNSPLPSRGGNIACRLWTSARNNTSAERCNASISSGRPVVFVETLITSENQSGKNNSGRARDFCLRRESARAEFAPGSLAAIRAEVWPTRFQNFNVLAIWIVNEVGEGEARYFDAAFKSV